MDWGAFAAGFTGEVLDSVKARELEQAKKRERELLAQLQRETAEWEFNKREELEKKKVKNSRFDPETGMTTDVNEYGETVGAPRRDKVSIDAYQQNKQKFDMDIANTKSQIAARNEGLALERERNSIARQSANQRGASVDGSGFATGEPSTDWGRMLFGANKTVVEAAIKDGIPAETLDRLSVESAARVKARGGTSAEAQRLFLDGITELRKGLTTSGWSLDSYKSGRQ